MDFETETAIRCAPPQIRVDPALKDETYTTTRFDMFQIVDGKSSDIGTPPLKAPDQRELPRRTSGA